VIANSKKAERVNFSLHQLYLALAKEIPVNGSLSPNPHFSWNEIDTSLPSTKIEVMGPPNTSGTRDMFEQLAIKKGCEIEPIVAKMETGEPKGFCSRLRQDGHFVEMGEDDLEIVKKLNIFENSFGIFGYSYVLNHSDIVQPNAIEGILPSNETIESGEYPLSRPLYLYVKNRRISSTPGLGGFLKEYLSDKAIGEEGYLQDVGLVPLGYDKQSAAKAALMKILPP
jgi:phosphate transport system substrate-binding protein